MWPLISNIACLSNETRNNVYFYLWPWTLGWPWPLWPLTLTNVTYDLDPHDPWPSISAGGLSNKAPNHIFWSGDLDLWPMTLTIRVDLWAIPIHALTKFHDPMCNGSWNMNFGLVTDIQTDRHTDRMHMSPPCICTGGLGSTKCVTLQIFHGSFTINDNDIVIINLLLPGWVIYNRCGWHSHVGYRCHQIWRFLFDWNHINLTWSRMCYCDVIWRFLQNE